MNPDFPARIGPGEEQVQIRLGSRFAKKRESCYQFGILRHEDGRAGVVGPLRYGRVELMHQMRIYRFAAELINIPLGVKQLET